MLQFGFLLTGLGGLLIGYNLSAFLNDIPSHVNTTWFITGLTSVAIGFLILYISPAKD